MSDIYLDINYSNELLQAVRQAFEHNLLILGFNQTVHNRLYIAPDHLFESSEVSALVETIKLAFQMLIKCVRHLENKVNMQTMLIGTISGNHANCFRRLTCQMKIYFIKTLKVAWKS